jgi:hypothetical protein
MVAYVCSHSILEEKEGGSQVWGQTGLHRDTQSQTNKQTYPKNWKNIIHCVRQNIFDLKVLNETKGDSLYW